MTVAIVGAAIFVIALVVAFYLVNRPVPGRTRQTRIPLFVLYFWALVFVQLIVVSIGYALLNR